MYNRLDTYLCSNFSLPPSIKISVKTKIFCCGFCSQQISRVFQIIIIFWRQSNASCFYFAFVCLCYILCFFSYHASVSQLWLWQIMFICSCFWYYPKHCFILICLLSWSFWGIGFWIKQQSWIYHLSLCNGVQVFLRFPFAQDHTRWNLLCWFSFKFCRLSRFPKNRFSDIWSHVYKEILPGCIFEYKSDHPSRVVSEATSLTVQSEQSNLEPQ